LVCFFFSSLFLSFVPQAFAQGNPYSQKPHRLTGTFLRTTTHHFFSLS
jgi:hypothetical protein